MAKAKKVRLISFTLPNKVGLLSEITTAINRAKTNINAIDAYELEGKANFMLLADNTAKTKKALAPLGVKIKETDVLAVEITNRVGELKKLADKFAKAKININYMYGTTGPGKTGTCIFKTSDDKKAIKVINL